MLLVPVSAVRRSSDFGSVDVRRGFELIVVPGERVRRPSLADARDAAHELLGRRGNTRFLERMGFLLFRPPEVDEVVRVLMTRCEMVDLEDDHARWEGPALRPQRPEREFEPAFERPPPLTWVAVTVVDEEDRPLAGAQFRLRLPDASTLGGALDPDGHTRVDNIAAGRCWLELTDLRRGLQR